MSHEPLYHYCTNDAFTNIIKGKTIRLSSLLLSNDSTEGRLVGKLLADHIRQQNYNADKADYIDEIFEMICAYKGGYGFCLSEGEDLLSQWCRYADDGKGIAIGFSRTFLESLSQQRIDLKQVEYDPNQQYEVVDKLFQKLIHKTRIDHNGETLESKSLLDLLDPEKKKTSGADGFMASLSKANIHKIFLNADIFRLKHTGFIEEREWRLLKIDNNVPPGGFTGTTERIKPYIECNIYALKDPIIKVMIGPKNTTPAYVVKQVLENKGYQNVTIKNSEIPYQ